MGLLVAVGSISWWSVEFEPWGARSPADLSTRRFVVRHLRRQHDRTIPFRPPGRFFQRPSPTSQGGAIAYGFGVRAGVWDRRRRRIAVPYGSRCRELGCSPGMAATAGLLVGLHGVDAGRSDFLAASQCRVCRGPPSFDAKANHTRTVDCAPRDGSVVRCLPLRIGEQLSLDRGATRGVGRAVRRLCRLPSAHWSGEGPARQGQGDRAIRGCRNDCSGVGYRVVAITGLNGQSSS